MKGSASKYISMFVTLIFIVFVLVYSLSFYKEKSDGAANDERDRIMAYSVQCYASEGFYPPNLQYLEHEYSLVLKRQKFNYFYDSFASNLRPDIIVVNKFDEAGANEN